MSDIVDRIRSVETTPLHGTDQWVELWEVLQDARAEIERLRSRPCPYVTGNVTRYCTLNTSEKPNSSLTDEEREAVVQAIGLVDWHKAYFSHLRHDEPLPSDTLRGLLERLK